ncbi:hypothetical protein [Agromyces sp. PvR057]|uniref:hypothetical protein n=1 Tax=Agromyces sp. PvR057 TaxID=3156403 RepID=UPI00339A90E4
MVVGMPNPRARRLALAAAVAAGAAGAALAMALSGCSADVEPTAAPTPSTSSDAAPIFASDEEALAAAVAAYEAYLDVAQEIGEEGGEDPGRLRNAVTSDYADQEIPNYESLSEHHYRVEGRGSLDKPTLMERSDSTVRIYGCIGVGTSRVLDAEGNDITQPDRDSAVPLELTFSWSGDRLLLAGSDVWSGEDYC